MPISPQIPLHFWRANDERDRGHGDGCQRLVRRCLQVVTEADGQSGSL